MTSFDAIDRRVPPHSPEAERAVLGGVLLKNAALDLVRDRLHDDDFYVPAHRRLFTAICALHDRADNIDPITLREELKARKWFDDCGGSEYIDRLLSEIHTTANIEEYAGIVAERAQRRRIIQVAYETLAAAHDDVDDNGARTTAGDVLATAQQALSAVAIKATESPYSALEAVLADSLTYIEDRAKSGLAIGGIPSGLPDLDDMLDGFKPSELIILAARPGMGKTALALNIAVRAAIDGKIVLFFSCEMSATQLGLRMISAQAAVNPRELSRGRVRDADYVAVTQAVAAMVELPIYVDDSSNIVVSSIRAKAGLVRAEAGSVGLIIVDYIQLMGTEGGKKSDNRERDIANITRGLKMLAKDFECPVLALSQLNRQLENRPDKRPRQSDLRESGAIEQDADVILFLYRDSAYWTPEDWEVKTDPMKTEIIVGKQRSGPTGTVLATFIAENTAFKPYTGRNDG